MYTVTILRQQDSKRRLPMNPKVKLFWQRFVATLNALATFFIVVSVSDCNTAFVTAFVTTFTLIFTNRFTNAPHIPFIAALAIAYIALSTSSIAFAMSVVLGILFVLTSFDHAKKNRISWKYDLLSAIAEFIVIATPMWWYIRTP